MSKLTSSRVEARGFALFTSLMFLVILTALAAMVLKTSTDNERIAGGDLDRAFAYQLAEATIRDAQQDILNMRSTGVPCISVAPAAQCRPQSDTPNKDVGMGDISYVGTCLRGRCYYGPGSDPNPALPATDSRTMYDNPGFVQPWDRARLPITDAAREYAVFGEVTDPSFSEIDADTANLNWKRMTRQKPAVDDAMADPNPPDAMPVYWIELFSFGPANTDRYFYRITVEATGRNPSTVVRLQEIYEPAL